MMGRSLLIVGALGTIAVAVAGGLGYGLSSPADAGMPTHIVAALVAILMVMFAHSWILLYLLGTGRMIHDTVRTGGLDPALLAESRRLRRVCYACLLAAAALVMATFLVGGAVAGKGVPPWVHHLLAWVAAAAQGLALWIEWRTLAANERLMGNVDQGLVAASQRVSAAL